MERKPLSKEKHLFPKSTFKKENLTGNRKTLFIKKPSKKATSKKKIQNKNNFLLKKNFFENKKKLI